ncbi:hypothetical protein Tco_0475827 [Tanacetum coccineum]
MFLPLQEDQHSYDVHRDMRKVIVFQTWLSKFPIFLDQLLDREVLTSYSDTIDVEDQQMIFQQLTPCRLHMPAILPGRVFVLKEIDCFLRFVMDEALDIVAVVGETVAINSSETVLSED